LKPWLLHGHLPGIGEVALSGWFTWLLVALVTGAAVAVREARRSGDDSRRILQLTVLLVLAGLAGGRLGHVLTAERAGYIADPLRLLRFWEGGMVLYGGLIGASLAGSWWCRTRRMDLLRTGDILAPAVLIGIALGRLGCLTAGCCYGRPIDWGTGIEWPWGLVFLSGQVPSALRGIPLHPTQVYASLNALLLFGLLMALRRRQRFDGQVVAAFLLAYGATRPLLELFRLDLERGFVLPDAIGETLSTSQAISIPILLGGAGLYVWARARARTEGVLGLPSAAVAEQRLRTRIEAGLAQA
jgi:phosphatidylglycerol---prolipoprotein diacylglyceryl transferase